MFRKVIAIFVAAVLLCLPSCRNVGKRQSAPAEEVAGNGSAGGRDLELPPVPATLTTPDERAAWLAVHYWDRLDFADTELSLDSAFMEQAFANYTTVLAVTADSVRSRAVSALMRRAEAVSAARDFLADIASRYLYDPESPVYDEDMYLPFVDYEISRSGHSFELEQLRADILKNRPGCPAPDFELTYPDGHRARLLRAGDADILLIFYEPDCNVCHDTMERLAADPGISQAVAEGRMRIVAVYLGDNTDAWREHAATLPPSWEVTRDAAGAVDGESLYIIRTTPSVYLISGGIIQAKDLGI